MAFYLHYCFDVCLLLEVTSNQSFNYLESKVGVAYNVSEKKNLFIKGKLGGSSLTPREQNFNNYNYHSSFALTRMFDAGKMKIGVEPEVTYYFKSYKINDDVLAKPTTFGVNLIASW